MFCRDDLFHVGQGQRRFAFARGMTPGSDADVHRRSARYQINLMGVSSIASRNSICNCQGSLPDIMSRATFSALSIGSNSSTIWYVRIRKNA